MNYNNLDNLATYIAKLEGDNKELRYNNVILTKMVNDKNKLLIQKDKEIKKLKKLYDRTIIINIKENKNE